MSAVTMVICDVCGKDAFPAYSGNKPHGWHELELIDTGADVCDTCMEEIERACSDSSLTLKVVPMSQGTSNE